MNILILDPHPVMADALALVVRRVLTNVCITQSRRLGSLKDIGEKGPCDLVIVDPELVDGLGLQALSSVREVFPAAKVVIFHARSLDEQIANYILEENMHRLSKTIKVPVLQSALRRFLSQESQASVEPTLKLSKRMKQLLLLLDSGNSNRDIAEKLCIKEHTVKVLLNRLYRRLSVTSRTKALTFARQHGWL